MYDRTSVTPLTSASNVGQIVHAILSLLSGQYNLYLKCNTFVA